MQFTINFKVAEDYSTVRFKTFGHAKIKDVLIRLGGTQQESIFHWQFPKCITTAVLKEVIHNTCFVCGGLMQDADINTQKIHEWGRILPVKKLRKCSQCGHSHT